MKRIIRVFNALRHVWGNMRRYPGLFMVLDRSVGKLPDSAADFIAEAVSEQMDEQTAQNILNIVEQYTAIPEDPHDQHGPVAIG